MQIGAMNHPGRDLFREIEWIAEMGFDFIDLTLEPPMAEVRRLNLQEVRAALESSGLAVVGHTAYYLPLCSPFESLRRAAVDELKSCLEAFAQLGAPWMNLHPDHNAPLHDRKFIIEQNLKSLKELLPVARTCGTGLMIENLPGHFNTGRQVAELLDPIPELGLHLDIGHANLLVELNSTDDCVTYTCTTTKAGPLTCTCLWERAPWKPPIISGRSRPLATMTLLRWRSFRLIGITCRTASKFCASSGKIVRPLR
jgi:endonuclease IV